MTDPAIIGVDPDCRQIAYCAVARDTVLGVGTIPRSNSTGRILDGYDSALTTFMRRCQDTGAVVYIEGIFLSEHKGKATPRNVQGFQRLAEVRGEILRAARMHSVPVETVNPCTWQSAVLGVTKGRENIKIASLEQAKAFTNNPNLTEHEADACCIAAYVKKNRL